jgi:hypothetical protein
MHSVVLLDPAAASGTARRTDVAAVRQVKTQAERLSKAGLPEVDFTDPPGSRVVVGGGGGFTGIEAATK